MLCASVLHLRGPVTEQPLSSSQDHDHVLLWNGEAYAIDGHTLAADENDTRIILARLEQCATDAEVLAVFAAIRGPWACVYFRRAAHQIWFGRDYFGRRSLCWLRSSILEEAREAGGEYQTGQSVLWRTSICWRSLLSVSMPAWTSPTPLLNN